MNYLFLDNFRGFYKTIIPIADVNFMVGENSTGKTSILSLLQLISGLDFWMTQEFNSEEIAFGSFDEIANIGNDRRKNFKIGLWLTKKEPNDSIGYLLSFIEKKGTPKLEYHCLFYQNSEVIVRFERNGVYFTKNYISRRKISEEFITSVFKRWANPKSESVKFVKAPNHYSYLKDRALLYANNLLLDKKNVKEQKSERQYNLLVPSIADTRAWIGPVRSKPQKTYDEFKYRMRPEGEHIPYVLKDILKDKKSLRTIKNIEKFGKESGLLESISIDEFYKGKVSSPFSILITLNNKNRNIINVGYGISQILPILVDIIARRKGCAYFIQQPEIHLHPRAQAALGGLIFDIAKNEDKKFFIETHSDYIIDRFRLQMRKNKVELKSQVLFFEKCLSGNKVHSIGIDKTGEYSEAQPKKFREFFIKEELSLLGIR